MNGTEIFWTITYIVIRLFCESNVIDSYMVMKHADIYDIDKHLHKDET